MMIMGDDFIHSDEIRHQQSTVKAKDIPVCSLCQEKPDHIGKIVAAPNSIFLCRRCIQDASDALKDTGFPLG